MHCVPNWSKKSEVMTSTEKDNRDEDKLFLQTSLSAFCRGIGSRRGRSPIRADAVCVENRKQCVARWGHLKWADVSAAERISDRCCFIYQHFLLDCVSWLSPFEASLIIIALFFFPSHTLTPICPHSASLASIFFFFLLCCLLFLMVCTIRPL